MEINYYGMNFDWVSLSRLIMCLVFQRTVIYFLNLSSIFINCPLFFPKISGHPIFKTVAHLVPERSWHESIFGYIPENQNSWAGCSVHPMLYTTSENGGVGSMP